MSGMTIKQALAVIQTEVNWHAGSDTHYRAEKLDQSLATLRAEIEALRAEVERLRTDLMESDEIREKLGHLLTRTAAALKGEPPAGVWHSWHDLPEKAAQLAEALRDAHEALADAANTMYGICGESQFCYSCNAFERANQWRQDWHGGDPLLQQITDALEQENDDA